MRTTVAGLAGRRGSAIVRTGTGRGGVGGVARPKGSRRGTCRQQVYKSREVVSSHLATSVTPRDERSSWKQRSYRTCSSDVFVIGIWNHSTRCLTNASISFSSRDCILARPYSAALAVVRYLAGCPSRSYIVYKRLKIPPVLLWNASRKPYPSYRMVPFSMTLSDP